MKGVYIVGEDPVTLEIIHRILSVYAPNLQIIQTLPARGSEIKNKIGSFNPHTGSPIRKKKKYENRLPL